MLKFTVSGLRGIVDIDINSRLMRKYAYLFTKYTKADKVLIARDGRNTGEEYADAVKRGVSAAGASVVYAHIVPTPIAVFGSKYFGIPAMMITASHNPEQWNGIKFIADGRFLNGKKVEKFKKFIEDFIGDIEEKKFKEKKVDLVDIYIKSLKEEPFFKNLKLPFKVGIDTINGAAYPAAKKILEAFGAKVSPLHYQYKYAFERGPEPTRDNLEKLSAFVIKNKLDMGFGFDPDGDRVSFILENGEAVGEEVSLALSLYYFLNHKKGSIVVNYSTSKIIDYIASLYNVKLYRAPVGEANVVDSIKKHHSKYGGEGNGGVILSGFNATRDGMVGMLAMGALYSEENIESLIDSFPRLYMIKDKFPAKKKFASIKYHLKDKSGNLDSYEDDGILIEAPNFFIHVRPSNTEDVFRVIIEADSSELAFSLYEEIKALCVE